MLKEVTKYFQDLSSDDAKLEKIIDDQMFALVKEEHPDDYKEYMGNNSKKLDEIKQRIKDRYKKEVQPRISNILTLSN